MKTDDSMKKSEGITPDKEKSPDELRTLITGFLMGLELSGLGPRELIKDLKYLISDYFDNNPTIINSYTE